MDSPAHCRAMLARRYMYLIFRGLVCRTGIFTRSRHFAAYFSLDSPPNATGNFCRLSDILIFEPKLKQRSNPCFNFNNHRYHSYIHKQILFPIFPEIRVWYYFEHFRLGVARQISRLDIR